MEAMMLDFDDREQKQQKSFKKVLEKIKTVQCQTSDMRDELDLEEETIEDLDYAINNASGTVNSATARVKQLQETSGVRWHMAFVVVLLIVFVSVSATIILIGML